MISYIYFDIYLIYVRGIVSIVWIVNILILESIIVSKWQTKSFFFLKKKEEKKMIRYVLDLYT